MNESPSILETPIRANPRHVPKLALLQSWLSGEGANFDLHGEYGNPKNPPQPPPPKTTPPLPYPPQSGGDWS